jgi:hypothetical protein
MKSALGAWVSGIVVCAAVPFLLGLLFLSPVILLVIFVYLMVAEKEST